MSTPSLNELVGNCCRNIQSAIHPCYPWYRCPPFEPDLQLQTLNVFLKSQIVKLCTQRLNGVQLINSHYHRQIYNHLLIKLFCQ